MKVPSVRRHWDPVEFLNQHLNRLFEMELESHALRQGGRFPLVNLLQTATEYIATVEIPGVPLDSLKLEVSEESLRLSGWRDEHQDVDEDHIRRQERWMGHWDREVVFPNRVDPESVTAELADGVLIIRVGKAKIAQPREVQILVRGRGGRTDVPAKS